MDPLDIQGQFFPFISTAISGNEHHRIIQHMIFLSFYGESSNPPPMSSLWDIPRYP